MSTQLVLHSPLAYFVKVFVSALEELGLQGAVHQVDYYTVLVVVDYHSLSLLLTQEIDKYRWRIELKNGIMRVVGDKDAVDADVKDVNEKILYRLRKLGVSSEAVLENAEVPVIIVSLEDVALKVLQKVFEETSKRKSDISRLVKAEYGSLENYTYILLYEKLVRKNKLKEVLDSL